jgi:hypothetical protein
MGRVLKWSINARSNPKPCQESLIHEIVYTVSLYRLLGSTCVQLDVIIKDMCPFFQCFKNDSRRGVLMAVTLKNTIFLDVIRWNLVKVYQHFIFKVEE